MKSVDFNTILINGYFKLLNNLNAPRKRALIKKLTQSFNTTPQQINNFEKSFGSWQGEETADELVLKIKASRSFIRKTEEL